jgi:hypothetical protein
MYLTTHGRHVQGIRGRVSLLCLFPLACGGQTAEPPLDGLYKTGPSVVPAASEIVALECTPQWNNCVNEKDCCYGPCRILPETLDAKDPIGACIGCWPPGYPCHNTSDCCGRCSRECDVRDPECGGVCLLELPGDLCRADNECLFESCVDNHCL